MASKPQPAQDSIYFGDDFVIDLRAYELCRSGRPVKLEHVPMDVLLCLLDRAGELVSRDEIVEAVWGKNANLDADNSLNGAIRKIRQALADDSEHPKYVQTIAGRGYRFIAPVERFPERHSPAKPDTTATSERRASVRLGPRLAIAIVVVSAVTLLVSWRWSRSRENASSGTAKVMVAVLPFENMTGDGAQDYFSDGLTEEMIARLGNINPQRMGVIARTSVMRYKGTREGLPRVSADLGVQYVLEGSVRRDEDKVRVTVQLIRASDQTHVWARQYDRELRSLLAVQAEIAQAVANEIRVSLAGIRKESSSAALSTAGFEAYDLYLKARYLWNKRTAEGFREATRYFEQAIAKDPAFAPAYAGLADTYALMASYSQGAATDLMPKARTAAVRALELDDGLAEAHTSLALIALNYDWDWKTAEKEYRRAIELDPNYATAHQWYAEFMALQGRFNEALAEAERARRLDPLSLIIAADTGAILYFARQHDRAIEQFQSVLAVDRNFPRAHMIVYAYVEKGMFDKALGELDAWDNSEQTPWTCSLRAYVHGRAGRTALAQRTIARCEQLKLFPANAADVMLAIAYAGMNDRERPITFLQRAYLAHSHALTVLKVDPIYDRLRSDSRFKDLMHRVGLADD